MTTPLLAAEDLREPPPPLIRVYYVCGIGLAFIFVAFILGLVTGAPKRGFEEHSLDGVRFLLCALGMVVIGSGISLRPGFFGGWVFFALGGIFGYGFGGSPPKGTEWQAAPPRDWLAALPNSWDSIQILFGYCAIAGLIAVIITNLSRKVLLAVVTLGITYHWAAIYAAVSIPPPQPWWSGVYWNRVAGPYLQPMYLTNAYQFYSPDPGPATELWVCIEYVDPRIDPNDLDALRQSKEARWIYIPQRERDCVDPLGLYYFRMLALTENISHVNYNPISDSDRSIVWNRRDKYLTPKLNPIPRNPAMNENSQFRPPSDIVIRHILPNFVRHFAKRYERENKVVHSVKVYRVLHTLLELSQIRNQVDPNTNRKFRLHPYDPITYRPYFLGEYDRNGQLKDPNDGMLYWLLPIIPRKVQPSERLVPYESFNEYYTDYVSEHAGSNRFESFLRRTKE